MSNELEVLTSLSSEELRALAASQLAPTAQARLEELLTANRDGGLDADAINELDALLRQVDQLNILKARARFTIQKQGT